MAKRMKRAWAKRFSTRTMTTANKAVLKEYADRPKSYGKNMPMSAVGLDDLNKWAAIPIRQPDNCPPRIRALLTMRAHETGLYDKFYIISIADGKYTKIDMFHSGNTYFFIKQEFNFYYKSPHYSSRDYALTAYRYGQIAWSFVYKEEDNEEVTINTTPSFNPRRNNKC